MVYCASAEIVASLHCLEIVAAPLVVETAVYTTSLSPQAVVKAIEYDELLPFVGLNAIGGMGDVVTPLLYAKPQVLGWCRQILQTPAKRQLLLFVSRD